MDCLLYYIIKEAKRKIETTIPIIAIRDKAKKEIIKTNKG